MNQYIKAIADREGETQEKIFHAIQEAINAAWNSDNPQHHQAQKNLTGSTTAPNPEELIAAIINEVKKRR